MKPDRMPERWPVADIHVGKLARAIDPKAVDTMVESIKRLGLQTPLSVYIGEGETLYLVAGAHRLEAVKRLGWEFVDVFVIGRDETEARLWQLAENLHRKELTVQERSEMIAEWVKLVATKGDQLDHPGGKQPHDKGVSAATRELGVTRAEVSRANRIAGISPDAKKAAEDAGLGDNQSALLAVAAEQTPDAQVEKVRELKRRKDNRTILQQTGDAIVKADADDEAARILIDHLASDLLEQLLLHLDAGKHGKLTAAVRRILIDRTPKERDEGAVFDRTRAGRAA